MAEVNSLSSSSTMAEVNSVTQSSEQPNKMAEAVTNQNPLPNISENEAEKGERQNIHEEFVHKNRLQELTQRSSLDRPVYHTVNVGSQHAPMFKSRVLVDGCWYISPSTFSHLKAAEQDAAKVALIGMKEKMKHEGCPLIREVFTLKNEKTELEIEKLLAEPSEKDFVDDTQVNLEYMIKGVKENSMMNMKRTSIRITTVVDKVWNTKKYRPSVKAWLFPSLPNAYAFIVVTVDISRILDMVFCKSILNEYAAKMNLEKPTYQTVQSAGLLPAFKSTSVFNGIQYTGETGKNKKEAEQLAARAAVMSILDNGSGTVMFEIIKSKRKLYAALDKVQDKTDFNAGFMPMELSYPVNVDKRKKVEIIQGAGDRISTGLFAYSLGQPSDVQAPNQLHDFKRPKLGSSSVEVSPPIVFVPPVLDPSLICSTSRKKRRNKKKTKKNVQVGPQVPAATLPLAQVPPCSVAQ
ncbi:hypothetical protein HAX54_037635 [Datura stramonium]|uniref:DRBM domain-containing protein n=1 Tax=Datura stramonium TaxID=4076 RepID=A0ABS8VJC0_DATST|nr:hypothetical protein [Datura stramonium]